VLNKAYISAYLGRSKKLPFYGCIAVQWCAFVRIGKPKIV
jgi:hypothetical protein